MTRVYVDGQEGTTGLRIREVLSGRDDIDLLTIEPAKRKDAAERARLLNAAEVAFLCLPDDAAREAVALVENPATCVIDASTAHRTAAGWVFGLPELARDQRDRIRQSKRIANPGCHATSFVLLIRPLVAAGVLPASLPLTATSITGYSGGGRKMIEHYETSGDARLTSPRPYALGLAHKHLPEMTAHSGLAVPPVFMPVVANFYQGLAVSVPLQLSQLGRGANAGTLREALADHYAGERFVCVMPLNDPETLANGALDVQGCNGTNRVDVFVFGGGDQALLIARLDNLGKGASGAAVQCMNIHLGVDETIGLETIGSPLTA
jgi:N-acetyl-gamma-glutamyl-phosphate reductase